MSIARFLMWVGLTNKTEIYMPPKGVSEVRWNAMLLWLQTRNREETTLENLR